MNNIIFICSKIEDYLPVIALPVIPERDKDELRQAKLAYKICLLVQKSFSYSKFLPQYKYISRPIYKFVASKTNPVLATITTFFLTDLIIHQCSQKIVKCLISSGQKCSFNYDIYSAGIMMVLSVPVIIIKYNNR